MPKMGKPLECRNGIMVIGCSSLKSEDIIRQIFAVKNFHFPDPVFVVENIKSYPCHIDTKYYATDVFFFAVENKDLVNADFASVIQAVIIHFDSQKRYSFDDVLSWMPFIEVFYPHVQILACDNCSKNDGNPDLTRKEIINWCLKNQFELVELSPCEDSDDEDDFKETTGYERIVQALHAHTWSDLVMKDEPSYVPSQKLLDSLNEDESSNSADSGIADNFENLTVTQKSDKSAEASGAEAVVGKFAVKSEQSKKDACKNKIDTLLNEDKWLFEAIGQEDPEGQSFESLFEKFRGMKEKAESLSGEERRLYAEKVALAFWKAVGGDDDEIAGLDES